MESKQISGYLYIFEDIAFPDYIKVGMSVNPIYRIKQYNTDKPYPTTSIVYISKPFKNISGVEKQILSELHSELSVDEIVTGAEWFNIVDLEYITNKVLSFEDNFEIDDSLEILSTQKIVENVTKKSIKNTSITEYNNYVSWCSERNIKVVDKEEFYYIVNKYLSYMSSFKNLVILLEEDSDNSILKYVSYNKYPILEEAIEILGFKKIKAEQYVIKNITKILLTDNINIFHSKIIYTIENSYKFNLDDYITAKEAKNIIKNVYGILKINSAPKGADLVKYLNLEESCRRIHGTSTRGYIYKGVKK